jgi:hypothetical protein
MGRDAASLVGRQASLSAGSPLFLAGYSYHRPIVTSVYLYSTTLPHISLPVLYHTTTDKTHDCIDMNASLLHVCVRVVLLRGRFDANGIVDSEQTRSCFQSALEAPDLAYGWL